MRKLWQALLVLAFVATSQVFADTKVQKIEVNGFTVYLVDMQKGNQFGYVFSVPYGSADDPPEFFGRAHFFEHMYSRGSTKFPGHETLIEAITKYGYRRNASTGYGNTSYHGAGLEDYAADAMVRHLAPLFGIELSESSMTREKKTVTNEIVGSAPNRPARSIFSLPFMYLPEPGHLSRGHYVGDDETLKPMSDENLRDLLNQIYHAGNVKLALIGNFTSGKWNAEKLTEFLRTALPPVEHKKARYVPIARPPVFAKDQVIEVELKSERSGMMFLPIDPAANLDDVRAFATMYSLKARNSILEVGQLELGWLRDVSHSEFRIADQRFLVVSFDMTEAGYSKREEVAQWLMDSIKRAGEVNISEELISQKAKEMKVTGRRMEENVDKLVSGYSSWLGAEGYEDQMLLDWKKVSGTINNDAIRRGAKAIRFNNKAVAFVGPSINEPRQFDSLYKRSFNTHAWQATKVTVPLYDPTRLTVAKVDLPALAESGERRSAEGIENKEGWTVVGQDSKDWNDRTVTLRINLKKLTPLQNASAQAWMFALVKKLTPEILLLASRGVSLQPNFINGNFVVTSTGGKGLEFSAIEWLLNELNSFTPTELEIENFRDSLKLIVLGSEDGFPGSVVADVAHDLFAPRAVSSLEAQKTLQSLNGKTVANVRKTMNAADKVVAIAGKYDARELEQLKSVAEVLTPKALNAKPARGYQVSQSSELIEPWQDETSSGVGVARLMPAPKADNLREQAAIRVVIALLHEKIFLRNRPFGYMQMASRQPFTLDRQQIIFVGQADREDQIPGIEAVWDEEVNRWLNDQVSAEEIEKGRSSVSATLARLPGASNEAANELLAYLYASGSPFDKQVLHKIAGELTHDEIKTTAKKYLSPDQPRLTLRKGIGKFSSCEDMISARKAWRKANKK